MSQAGLFNQGSVGGVLPVSSGGTGASTLTGVLTGNGTSPITGNPVTQFGTLVAGASNAVSSVSPGTSGQLLTSNGAGSNPTFQTIGAGNAVLISSSTASSSANIAFTSGMTGFTYYRVEFIDIIPSVNGANFQMEVSQNNGGVYQSAAYVYALQGLNTAGTISNITNGGTAIAVLNTQTSSGLSNVTSGGYNGVLNLFIPATGWSFGDLLASYQDTGTNPSTVTGVVGNTEGSINALRFTMSTGNIRSGTIRLLGIP